MNVKHWKDPRSIAFRAAVKGWAFAPEDWLPGILQRATPLAWLPEHLDTLKAIQEAMR